MEISLELHRLRWAIFITYQIVELNCGDALVNAVNHLHGDGCRVDMFWIKAITEPGDTGCDLVELDAFLAAI